MTEHSHTARTEPAALDRRLFAYRVANVLLFVSIGLLLGVLKSADVSDQSRLRLPLVGNGIPELCVYKRTLGVDCSSCGITRSVVLMLDGEFDRSQSFDPRGIEIAVFALLQLVMRGVFAFRRFASHWKWDALTTAVAIVACFARFIVELSMQP